MQPIRRSCQSTLQISRKSIPRCNYQSQRAFSQSTPRNRSALPVFLEPSTPQLSTLLATLNSKVLLPKHLTSEQAKLVYKQANRTRLEAEPIEITLGEVTLPLQHLDRTRDIPSQSSIFRDICSRSRTQDDWENVLRMLEGFENAGVHVKPEWQQKVVRKLGDHGMQHLVLKSLQRPRATGMSLKHEDVLMQVLRVVRDRAVLSEWDATELRKGLGLTEQIVELMEQDAHLNKTAGAQDLRTMPEVVAAPLEMASELAYRHDESDEKVSKYAARLMRSLEQHDFMKANIDELNAFAQVQEPATPFEQAGETFKITKAMTRAIPVWNALSTSRTVLEDKMPMGSEAQRVQKELRAGFQHGLGALKRLSKRAGKPFTIKNSDAEYVRNMIKTCEE